MKTIFNITLILSIIGLSIYAYWFHTLGLEWSKDFLIWLTTKAWHDIIFFKEFYYYMGLFLSVFFLPFSLMMTWRLHLWYVFLLGSFAFGGTAYYIEILRYSFIVPTIIFFCVFWFFAVTPKVKSNKLKRLKTEGIYTKAKYIDTITDYSVKMNGRPRMKAIADVINPHTWHTIRIESDGSFDPYFAVNMRSELDVYFDRHNENIYMIDVSN